MNNQKEPLKIRCSSIGKIVKLDRATQLTATQKKRVDELLKKETRTEKQNEELAYLVEKSEAPDRLSQYAKTHIEDLFIVQKSNFRQVFSSKYTQKGHISEQRAIDFLAEYIGLPVSMKNAERRSNEFITGEADLPVPPLDFVADVKNVYYPRNLDFFDDLDNDYVWQLHGYNWLWGTNHGICAKILLNPPEEILTKEIFVLAKESGLEWNQITDDFKNEVRDYFDFESKMNPEDRINLKTIKTTKDDILHIEKCVKLARDYWNELENNWNKKNLTELRLIKNLQNGRNESHS